MTEDEVRARVDAMVDRVRLIWGVIISAALISVFATDTPWWYAIIYWVVGVVGFNFHIRASATSLAKQLIQAGGLDSPTEDVGAYDEVEITAESDTIVGSYYDFDVPEWIDVSIGGETRRYNFHSFARCEGEAFAVPANGDTILYKAGLFQPAQSE